MADCQIFKYGFDEKRHFSAAYFDGKRHNFDGFSPPFFFIFVLIHKNVSIKIHFIL